MEEHKTLQYYVDLLRREDIYYAEAIEIGIEVFDFQGEYIPYYAGFDRTFDGIPNYRDPSHDIVTLGYRFSNGLDLMVDLTDKSSYEIKREKHLHSPAFVLRRKTGEFIKHVYGQDHEGFLEIADHLRSLLLNFYGGDPDATNEI